MGDKKSLKDKIRSKYIYLAIFVLLLTTLIISALIVSHNYTTHLRIENYGGQTGPSTMGFWGKVHPVRMIIIDCSRNRKEDLSFLQEVGNTSNVLYFEIIKPSECLSWKYIPNKIKTLVIRDGHNLDYNSILSGSLDQFPQLEKVFFIHCNYSQDIKNKLGSRYPTLEIGFLQPSR